MMKEQTFKILMWDSHIYNGIKSAQIRKLMVRVKCLGWCNKYPSIG